MLFQDGAELRVGGEIGNLPAVILVFVELFCGAGGAEEQIL